jgi:hypothetical protein
MKRTLVACAAALTCAGAIPAIASAKTMEIGNTTTALTAPVCPTGVSQTDCTIVLAQITVLQTVSDGTNFPTTITKPGMIAALTLGVSGLSTNTKQVASDISYLDGKYGGGPTVQVSILRPVGLPARNHWRVAAQSQVISLGNYLGEVAQFPLAQSLPVVPGEVVALTVPTWAPVLSIDLTGSKFAYRKADSETCKSASSTAELLIGQLSDYGCRYSGTRAEYSATEILTPPAAKSQ